MSLTLVDKSYAHILDKLVRGEVAPGDRLVTRALAQEIGVSLGPIREALNRLAGEGLVDHVPGAGAAVRQLDRQELEELYVLRDAVESCASAEAARHISEAQLDQLDAVVDDWEEIAANIKASAKGIATQTLLNRWLDNEEHFHEVLIEASHNRLLAKVIREHRAIGQIFEAQRLDTSLLTTDVAERTCRDRRQLMKALRNRDGQLARQLMSDQIRTGCQTVLRFLTENRIGRR